MRDLRNYKDEVDLINVLLNNVKLYYYYARRVGKNIRLYDFEVSGEKVMRNEQGKIMNNYEVYDFLMDYCMINEYQLETGRATKEQIDQFLKFASKYEELPANE